MLFFLSDDWLPRYLTVCPESDASVLINTIVTIVQRLKSKQIFEQEGIYVVIYL